MTPSAADCIGLGPSAIRRKFPGVSEHRARALAKAARELPAEDTVGAPVVQQQPQKLERTGDEYEQVITANGPRIKTLDELLTAGQVDIQTWSVKDFKLNSWEMATGEGVYYPLFQVKATLERKLGLAVRPAEPVVHLPSVIDVASLAEIPTAFFVPDTQHGFRWDERFTKLTPMHDRRAIDCALQLAAHIQPDIIVFLGDHLDCTEWTTKYERGNDTRQTTLPAIDELYWQLRQFRAACPSSRIVYVEGNHEYRIHRALLERMPEATALRPAGEQEPLMSVKRLLQLHTIDVEYVGPYGEDFWLWDTVRVTHAKSTGTQARQHPEVHGHEHDIRFDASTVHGPGDTIRVYPRLNPGSLCTADGTVPGAKPRFNWQQGVGVAWRLPSGNVHMQLTQIVDGVAVYDGRVFEGRDTAEAVAKATGWTQIAG